MKYDYNTLKSLADTPALGVIMKFLGKIKNARLGPADRNSPCPPVFFWWFEEDDAAVNDFIKNTVDSFPWEEPWLIQSGGNGKWLLFPKLLLEVEKKLNSNTSDKVTITDNSMIYVMNNDPDFGYRANKDLERFRIYFRAEVERYLKEKEMRDKQSF